eukprot:GFUD01062908.1.p1 GENE.GFUD01062908.1~~GFUD01062908.1.p1  ORF type:complete len:136 (+),score=17.79 GFUD01062908.1:75-482(+)
MSLSKYCGIPEDVLDGIFSTEEMEAWKLILEKKREDRKASTLRRIGSVNIEIESSDKASNNFAWNKDIIRSKPFQKLMQFSIKMLNSLLFCLTKCSYIPLLFLFLTTVLSLGFTALNSIILSLTICMSVAGIHLS